VNVALHWFGIETATAHRPARQVNVSAPFRAR
jgi:hypothetical protein